VYWILCGHGRKKQKGDRRINQIQDDIVAEQLSIMEYIDPFTGEEVQKKKRK
jgi:putative transposase